MMNIIQLTVLLFDLYEVPLTILVLVKIRFLQMLVFQRAKKHKKSVKKFLSNAGLQKASLRNYADVKLDEELYSIPMSLLLEGVLNYERQLENERNRQELINSLHSLY